MQGMNDFKHVTHVKRVILFALTLGYLAILSYLRGVVVLCFL